MVYVITIAVALLRTQGDIRLPFDIYLLASLGHLFGVALPTFLVAAVMHGRAGVRGLPANHK